MTITSRLNRRDFTRRLLASGAASWPAALAWPGPPAAAAAGPSQPKIQPPEAVSLTTKDGVELAATFYPGGLGERSGALIMVHGWNGQGNRFDSLAKLLQQSGWASLTLDLRGHGRSTRRRLGGVVDRKRMTRRDIGAMVLDLEAGKKFLLQKHNERQLNIELLALVAEREGAITAVNWAVMDWNAPRLPALKQGQDVKALVLLSPVQAFRGVTCQGVFGGRTPGAAAVRSRLSVMLIAGRGDPEAFREAERMYSSFKRFHRPRDDPKERDLVFLAPNTSLQGARLLTAPGVRVTGSIATFLDRRVAARAELLPWRERRNPLAS